MRRNIAILLAICVALSACSTVKRWVGLNKTSPDETKIETRDPLVLPPDFDDLP